MILDTINFPFKHLQFSKSQLTFQLHTEHLGLQLRPFGKIGQGLGEKSEPECVCVYVCV